MKKISAKKILTRVIGSLCIIAILMLFFFTAWVQVDGVKTKDMKDCRNQLLEQLHNVQNRLTSGIEYEYIKDDLDDNDLPKTKAAIKKRINETENVVKKLIDDEIFFGEIVIVAVKAPGYVTETNRLFDTKHCAGLAFNDSRDFIKRDTVEGIASEAADFVGVCYLVVGGFVVFVLLGCAASILNIFDKLSFVKYIFAALALMFILAVCIGIPILSNFIQNEILLAWPFENMSLKVSAAPYLTLLFVAAIIGLDVVANIEKKKKQEV